MGGCMVRAGLYSTCRRFSASVMLRLEPAHLFSMADLSPASEGSLPLLLHSLQGNMGRLIPRESLGLNNGALYKVGLSREQRMQGIKLRRVEKVMMQQVVQTNQRAVQNPTLHGHRAISVVKLPILAHLFPLSVWSHFPASARLTATGKSGKLTLSLGPSPG